MAKKPEPPSSFEAGDKRLWERYIKLGTTGKLSLPPYDRDNDDKIILLPGEAFCRMPGCAGKTTSRVSDNIPVHLVKHGIDEYGRPITKDSIINMGKCPSLKDIEKFRAFIRKVLEDSGDRLPGATKGASALAADTSSAGRPSQKPGDLSLYKGEIFAIVSGAATVYHFQRSERPATSGKSKPLMVCIPGAAHLGRIFYGGHEGSDPKNFLAYQLNQLGYDVLSISYPLDMGKDINKTMSKKAANFRIPHWGQQAAMTTKKVIDEESLSTRSIVLIGWSMAGRMPVPFNIQAKQLGLDVLQFVSFCATPGISGVRPAPTNIPRPKAGFLHMANRLEDFYKQLDEMRVINCRKELAIPRDIYLQDYTGGLPITLSGYGLKFDGKDSFIKDEVIHETETKAFDFANQPLITALYPDSHLDAVHTLTDKASWGFILTLKLESMIKQSPVVRESENWLKLVELIRSAPERLFLPVHGNHFFFVGAKSARSAAEAVDKLINEAAKFQEELSQFTLSLD